MRDRTAMLIETFASISPPGEFAISPDGLSVAFTQQIGGCAQVFVMPVEYAGWARRITATLDDCTEPRWSPDAKSLVIVRGQALWLLNADGTDLRVLTDHPAGNASAQWSPDGSRIAFISRRRGWNHLWTMSPAGDGLTQVTRGSFDAVDPVWSPDGKWLAFCSGSEQDLMSRGVYLVQHQTSLSGTATPSEMAERPRGMKEPNPSNTSESSQRLLFRSADDALVPANGGEPDLVTPSGCWCGAPSFSPDGKTLVYLSDQDGWFHIYLRDLASGVVRQLTHGEFEDGGPHFYEIDPQGGPIFSPDGKTVAFIRHREGKYDLWIADIASGAARRISSGEGYHRIVGWLPDSRRIAVTFSNPSSPDDLWLLSIEGETRQLIDSSVAELRAGTTITPEWLTYTARDGLSIQAALFRPRDTDKAPAVLFLHGGPNFAFGEFYYPLPQILAQEGYVVLAPNHRGSTGYGTAFRQANLREWGHADAFDAIDGARWLQMQDFVDPNRVAVVGPSYGGYLALSALTLGPELFCAGVDMYGDSDIADAYHHEDRDARLDLERHMGAPEENPEGYRRGSPLYRADQIQAPVLILHGQDDMLVVPRMSEKMIEALKIENKYFESHLYAGEEHGFEDPHNKKDAWERVVRFLNRHCKGE